VPVSIIKAEPTTDFPVPWGADGDEPGAETSKARTIPSELMPREGAVARKHAVALVIGIERYRADLPEASGAVTDAELFADFAEKTLGVPRSNIHLLTGDAATKSSIDAELGEWLPRNADSKGEVFFYYAGHGAPDTEGDKRYLVPWDADPKFIRTQGIAVDTLMDQLAKLKSAQVLSFVDSCFSGAGGRSVLPAGTRPIVLTRVRHAKPVRKPPKLMQFAASGPDEITGASETGNGLFSYYLFKALNGEADDNGDGAVTVGEVVSYTEEHVANAARRDNRDQRPSAIGADPRTRAIVLTRLPPRK
jgi:hypothetical protein